MLNVMVNNRAAALDATFSALAHPTRRAILARLATAPEATVTQLARPFAVSLPAVSRHLRILEGAGLVARRRRGRLHHLRLVPAPLEAADAWIESYRIFWKTQLDALEAYLQEPRPEDRRRAGPRGRGSRRR